MSVSAPRRLVAELAQRCPCHVRLSIEPVGRMDAAMEQAVYCCCAEALQNASGHAGAGAIIDLSLRRQKDELLSAVRDDGPGLVTGASESGRGMRTMRRRPSPDSRVYETLKESLAAIFRTRSRPRSYSLSTDTPCAAQA